MKKVYLSFPIEGRTLKHIYITIEKMSRKAKEIWGDDITIVTSFITPDLAKHDEYEMFMSDILKKRWPQLARFERLVQCDCFVSFESIFQDPVCQCEKELAGMWKLETYLYPNWAPIQDYQLMLFGEE